MSNDTVKDHPKYQMFTPYTKEDYKRDDEYYASLKKARLKKTAAKPKPKQAKTPPVPKVHIKQQIGNYTIDMARSGIFYPALRLSKKIKRITPTNTENNWYKITFDQLMDQIDFNLISAIFTINRQQITNSDGSMTFFFSMYDLHKLLNIKSRNNHNWIKDKLMELRKINIIIKPKASQGRRLTGIIRKVDYLDPNILVNKSKDTKDKFTISHDKRKLFGNNMLFYVTFESEFIRMVYSNTNIYCNKLMSKIFKIKSGTIQAMVKFLLTNKSIQISLDKLLYTIGIRTIDETKQVPGYIYTSAQRYKHIKSEIRGQKEMLKKEFGIEIVGNDIIQYTQHKDVWYSHVKLPKTDPETLEHDHLLMQIIDNNDKKNAKR